ncbi:MAG: hypothetical protein ACLFSW_07335, partial [Halobacteriales archaeon]
VYAAALLVAEAERDACDGDGRKTVVARRFVDQHLDDPDVTDEVPLERYEEIAKYRTVDVDDL